MKLSEMFVKKISRDIKGVIKVEQIDAENRYQELDEYVVTDELEKYMERFFDAYLKSMDEKTDKMGVWISGFFGSGKSHFLKILSYILENKKVYDEEGKEYITESFFTDTDRIKNSALREKIGRVATLSDDVDVILFNIDSKSESDAKLNKESIRDVFVKVFTDHLGYCGSIPFLADFERKLDEDGDYDRFKNRFEEIHGDSWENVREDYYFIQDEIIESVVSLGIMSEKEANNWAENAQNTYSMSVDRFAAYVQRYCAKKGKNHHVIFLVDEIGQYIANDGQLMVNLQTVVEDLGTACQGKAWIAVTSQQDINSIIKTIASQSSNNFSKIQGRFDVRIALSSANVDEVIRKRILLKSDIAIRILEGLYQEYESIIKNIIVFSEGTPYMPLYEDAKDFADVYPFIPYQFKLLGSVLTAVRQYSSSGKNMADGERSMLALFKEAAQRYADEREGILIPFNAFYLPLDDFIDHTHRIVITQAAKNPRLSEFDVEVLKVLFMVKHVNFFKSNAQNITTLMISNLNENTVELEKRVEQAFRLLANEGLVQKNGSEYIFLTNEEQDAENRIREIYVEPKEVVNYVAQVAFEEIIALPNNKYKYSSRYQFGFNQQIDDRIIRSNPANRLTLHLLTAYCGKDDDLSLAMLSSTEKSVVVRLSDDYAYLAETEEMKKIDSFLSKPDLAGLLDNEFIRLNKQKERSDRSQRIKTYVEMALESASIYVKGEKVAGRAKGVANRVNEAFAKLIAIEYSKLEDMETAPDTGDILNLLKKNKTQITLDLPGVREPNADALREVIATIQYEGKQGRRFSLKQALDKYMDAPYGYTDVDVEYLLATLYKKGQIALKMNSVVYSPASTAPDDAYRFFTKREYREKILLEMKAIPKTPWVKAVKDVITDFFGRTVVSEDTDAIMRDFRSFSQTKIVALQDILREDYRQGSMLPGKGVLEKAIRLMEETSAINDPMTFYERVDELYDDFDELIDDLNELQAFLSGVQKDKFNHACHTLNIFENSENYISDAQVIEFATQIRRLVNLQRPFSYIKELEEYDRKLLTAISDLLEKDAEKIEPEVYADRKLAMESIPEGRPYAERVQKYVNGRFASLVEKLKTTHDMAILNGIPAESTALLENCQKMIRDEEEEYQRSLQKSRRSDSGKVKAVEKEKTIRTIPVSMRTLTNNKTYTIRTQQDIVQFLKEMERELENRLEENVVIKLN